MKILTIDLEDWFHILDHPETATPGQWENFESRVERNTIQLLETLDVHKQRATFFCLGWIAKKYPSLVKQVAARHDIGCHSMNHSLVYRQSPEEFRQETSDCKKLIEDITGKQVNAYRAAGFSITAQTTWAFEVLAECGFEIDSSVFPYRRGHGGFATFPYDVPCIISTPSGELKELPLSTARLAGKRLVFSGGGYFRALPYALIRRFFRRSDYVMTYFHPRDFDAGQPVLKSLPLKRKIMSYTGLSSAGNKFRKLLADFTFTDVATAVKEIDWKNVPVYRS